jgi:DNA-binding transcriptional MerR regulator
MRPAGRTYSADEIADLAQCTSEQLVYYEEIQLLPLRERSGARAYDDLDLLRLQQIRIGRSWGLALEETRRWLAHCADPFPAEPPRTPVARPRRAPLYMELEVKAETERDRREFQREAERLYDALSRRWRAGSPTHDRQLRPWVERHRCHIERWFCPCEAQRHPAFARAILRNPCLAASIARHGESLGTFLLGVIEAHSP